MIKNIINIKFLDILNVGFAEKECIKVENKFNFYNCNKKNWKIS